MSRPTILPTLLLVLSFALATLSVASPAVRTGALPIEATGLLGALDTGDGAHRLAFDTSTGLYALDGLVRNGEATRQAWFPDGAGHPADPLWAFDFASLRIGPGTVVEARGAQPLLLLSKGPATVEGTLRLDGDPGSTAGLGAGGGGGGGGGALALLAQGDLLFTGRISADGGPGGQGDLLEARPADPQHSRGGDGGGGAILLGSAGHLLFDGVATAFTGGDASAPAGPVSLVGMVTLGPHASVNGAPAAAGLGLATLPSLSAADFYVTGGGGGAGAGGSGLPIDGSGRETRDGYAGHGGPGGLAGPGGGVGGAGAYAVAGGAGGSGGSGGSGSGSSSSGGAGGGGGGGGGLNGPGGSAGSAGSGARTAGASEAGDAGAPWFSCFAYGGRGGSSGLPASGVYEIDYGWGGEGGTGPSGQGEDGLGGEGVHSGTSGARGGGGGGGGGGDGGDGGNGGNGGRGSSASNDGGGGGGGGGGGADGCSPTAPGSGGNGGSGGTGTGSGSTSGGFGSSGGSGSSTSGGGGGTSSFHRDVVGPTTVNAQAIASAGASVCDDTLGSVIPALLCGTGGAGAIIALDGSAGEADLNPASRVSGTCDVTLDAPLQSLTSGDFSFSCGVDRDDDGFVTNLDSLSGDARGFDDDFSGDTPRGSTASVCFREDLDGSWDDMAVFIAANVPSTSVAVGVFSVDVSLGADSGCWESSGGTALLLQP